MAHKHVAECMDCILRDLCSCELPFGGKVIVFGGDFRQILLVRKRASRGEVVSACLNRSPLWRRASQRGGQEGHLAWASRSKGPQKWT